MTSADAVSPRTRVACLQVASPADEPSEQRRARVAERCRQVGEVDLLVLPELWPVGYFHFDAYPDQAEALDGPTVTLMSKVAVDLDATVVLGTLLEAGEGGIHNTAVVVGPDGNLVHTYRKMHLFGYGSREAELLTAGTDVGTSVTPAGRLGVSTCYDLRFPELYRLLSREGVEVIVVPAAWPASRLAHWRLLLQARALENQAWVVACNAVGTQAGTALGGHSMIVAPSGEIVVEASDEEGPLRAELDLGVVQQARAEFPVLQHVRIPIGAGGAR